MPPWGVMKKMSDLKSSDVRPYFTMSKKEKNILQTYLINNGLGPISTYIAKAVKNQMIRDGIISQDDKNT